MPKGTPRQIRILVCAHCGRKVHCYMCSYGCPYDADYDRGPETMRDAIFEFVREEPHKPVISVKRERGPAKKGGKRGR